MDARYEQQRSQLADIRERLSAVHAQASSADRLVTVTVDFSGIVTDVSLDPRALRTTCADLGRIVTETARAAARLAHQQTTETIAPIVDVVGSMPELADLLPGAPSLREPDTAITQDDAVQEDDDEYAGESHIGVIT
ncbi:YbaB/EbfC family nucleoid-associated protein [Nocardia sp. NPDC023852]|uniref:YbaB/EbfC family nucleoid-associated protein n=1 Tax=Nocardia sp. NPDC023852 TaxID=3154697 RepID=UPI0033FA4E44